MNDMPPTEDLVAMYKDMLLIRRFEEKAGQLYGMDKLVGSAISILAKKPSLLVCNQPRNQVIPSLHHIVTMAICWLVECMPMV